MYHVDTYEKTKANKGVKKLKNERVGLHRVIHF
jgi:hypothetical protein